MNLASSTVFNITAFVTTRLGLSILSTEQYSPFYFIFNLAFIIIISIGVGFMAEDGFKNLRKYYYDRLGKRHV